MRCHVQSNTALAVAAWLAEEHERSRAVAFFVGVTSRS
jgi:hypothetical protein